MIRMLLALPTLLLFINCNNANAPAPILDADTLLPVAEQVAALQNIPYQALYDQYDNYREKSIRTRRFKHADIVPLIQKLRPPFEVRKAGQSIEGRDIYRVSIGSGPTQVLLWSQMHGDEPTATMAIMDIFNFFSKTGDEFDELRQKLQRELTITFIPMLNPDGAERFTRRNALGVDLNRDALRLQCPESQILKNIRDELQADWGFNLHDQSRYYSAGRAPKTATISFLAPAYNYEKDINEVRGNAMRMIGLLNGILQQYIPGQVGRYDDTFEPRAFGDNIQRWGTSTILIECGGQPNDEEKQYIRKLNFVALLSSFDAIATRAYAQAGLEAYDRIPFNGGNNFYDLIVREAEVQKNGKWYVMDMGFRRNEVALNNNRSFYYKSSIAEFGDMSVFFGYDEITAQGHRAVPGKVYPTVVQNIAALKKMDIAGLLAQGYTDVQLRELPSSKKVFPLNLVAAGKSERNAIQLYGNPSFVLQKEGQIRYAVINGFAYNLETDKSLIKQLVNDF
ncbi:MAG TPA: M14 family zinc carboxypeptidase [Saprospiraceae bacterium]|nr:M14 family zinc carboxypeptidase [Saprospiraceae bacterium]HMP24622.1 M14 family zinc carboxypeptidase [Saprospiraceae bacterium]